MELLREFNEKNTIPNAVSVDVHAGICECDLSFLTAVTQLEIREMNGCSITLPTTVVQFKASHIHTMDVPVSGTENLTSVSAGNETVSVGECQKLRELAWRWETLSGECISFGYVTTLSQMTVTEGTIDPPFCFLSG